MSALNGEVRQCEGSLVTTSSWLSRMMGRLPAGDCVTSCAQLTRSGAALPPRGRQAQMLARPGAISKTLLSMPSRSKIRLKNSAARDSFPGGLVVLICRYSRSHCSAKSAYCAIRSAAMASEAIAVAFGAGFFAAATAQRETANITDRTEREKRNEKNKRPPVTTATDCEPSRISREIRNRRQNRPQEAAITPCWLLATDFWLLALRQFCRRRG